MGAIHSDNGVKFRGEKEGTGLNELLITSNVYICPKFANHYHSLWFQSYVNDTLARYNFPRELSEKLTLPCQISIALIGHET